MQAHSLFEPLLSFDLTQVGASKTRRLASTHRAGNVEGSRARLRLSTYENVAQRSCTVALC